MKDKKFPIWISGTHTVEYDEKIEIDLKQLFKEGKYEIRDLFLSLKEMCETSLYYDIDEIMNIFYEVFKEHLSYSKLNLDENMIFEPESLYELMLITKLKEIPKNKLINYLEEITKKENK